MLSKSENYSYFSDFLGGSLKKQMKALELSDALLQSDLTLCPAGVNTECYKYEACSYGSVPVWCNDYFVAVEIHMRTWMLLCSYSSPWMLLSSLLRTGRRLPAILEKEKTINLEEKIQEEKDCFTGISNSKQS